MEEKIINLYKKFRKQPPLWASWKHENTPICIFTDEKAYLFNHPSPPPEFQEEKLQGLELHTLLPPFPDYLIANTALEIGGKQTATLMYSNGKQLDYLGLLSHEAFHAYQGEKGFPRENIMLMPTYPVYDSLVNTLGEVEGNLLYAAVKEKDEEKAIQALKARNARQDLLSPTLREYEDHAELNEGLAVYVGMISAGIESTRGEKNLNCLLRLNKDGWGASRQRFYYSGMAYALLCHFFSSNWQEEITKSYTSPYKILARSLNYQPQPGEKIIPHDEFSSILSRQKKDASQQKKKITAEIKKALSGPGIYLEVIFKSQPKTGGWNPITVQVTPKKERFHPDILTYFYESDSTIRIDSNCLEKKSCAHFCFCTSGQILLQGKPITGNQGQGTIEVKGDRCYLLVVDGKIQKNEQGYIIEETPPG